MEQHNNTNALRRSLLGLTCVCLSFMLLVSRAEARIKYGLWEINISVQMDGTPVDNPQETIQKCINSKDLTPGSHQDNDGCNQGDVVRKGDTVNWTVSCAKDNHTMTGNGLVVYSGDTLTGNAQFQAGGKGMATMKMKLYYKGKRVGKCK